MGSIFDLDAIYDEGKKREYSLSKLQEALPPLKNKPNASIKPEVDRTRNLCAELCPMTLGGKPFPKTPEEKFCYLQFLYYIITKNRECKAKGYSVFDSIKNPSARHLELYTEMIGDIQPKVSKAAYVVTNGSKFETWLDSKPKSPDKGRYDDSIRIIQESADLVTKALVYAYDSDESDLNDLKNRERLFLECMRNFKEPRQLNLQDSQQGLPIESWWEELYLRLHYARCTYWEADLLWSYEEVLQMAQKSPSTQGNYFTIRDETARLSTQENDCILAFDKDTGQIIELPGNTIQELDVYPNSEQFKSALKIYVENHIDEIAKKAFSMQKVTVSDRAKIRARFPRVCAYFDIEAERYGRSSILSKIKLISIYQAFFLCLPKSNVAGTKSGTPKMQAAGNGRLWREKDSLSSSYYDPLTKEPLYLQEICIWTNYRYLWNRVGSFWAKKNLEINIAVLETILTVNYQMGMGDLQLRAEDVLFTTIETMVPDKEGEDQLEACIKTLSKNGRKFRLGKFRREALITFGKFCKVFGLDQVIKLIEKKINAQRQEIYQIDLNQIEDISSHVNSLILWITHNQTTDIYEFQSFDKINFSLFKAWMS